MQLTALEIDQGEIIGTFDFGEADAGAFEPEAAAFRIAQRQMTEVLVLMAIEGQNAATDGDFVQLFGELIVDHVSLHVPLLVQAGCVTTPRAGMT